MNRSPLRILLLAMVVSLCSFTTTRGMADDDSPQVTSEPTIQAGAAEIDVTPPAEGTALAMRPARSTGVEEPIFARALVLSDGSTRVAVVTCDYCGFDIPFNERLRKAIHEATEIPTTHIMINTSHNHSAPMIGAWAPPNNEGTQPWYDELVKKFATVAKQAAAQVKPCRLRFQREAAQIGINRRLMHQGRIVMAPNPHGSNLPWTDVLCAEVPGVERIGVLFSYAAHPVIVQRASNKIGGDYPGYAVKRMQAMARAGGSGGVFMFAQGAGGDINGFPLAGGIRAADTAARDLSYAVERAMKSPGHIIQSPRLRVASTELELPLQEPPSAEQIKKRIAETRDEARRKWLQGLLALADEQQPATLRFPISAFALGNEFCILALPHETFSYYTLFAESVSPFEHNMVLGYTNGMNGYIATRRDYLLAASGGYEAAPLGSALNYTTRLAPRPESQQIIEAGIRKILEEVSGQTE